MRRLAVSFLEAKLSWSRRRTGLCKAFEDNDETILTRESVLSVRSRATLLRGKNLMVSVSDPYSFHTGPDPAKKI